MVIATILGFFLLGAGFDCGVVEMEVVIFGGCCKILVFVLLRGFEVMGAMGLEFFC